MPTPQSIAYHVRAFAGSKWRQVGTVFVAGSDASVYVRGHLIYYRLLNRDYDLWMHRDMTTGFSKAVFDRVVADGVEWVVAHSKETGRMVVTPVSAFKHVENFGQGVQIHAGMDDSVILENQRRLMFPTAIPTIQVMDEAPGSEYVPPSRGLFSDVPSNDAKPKIKATTGRCGCYFENGVIVKPCLDHRSQWEPVLRARAS